MSVRNVTLDEAPPGFMLFIDPEHARSRNPREKALPVFAVNIRAAAAGEPICRVYGKDVEDIVKKIEKDPRIEYKCAEAGAGAAAAAGNNNNAGLAPAAAAGLRLQPEDEPGAAPGGVGNLLSGLLGRPGAAAAPGSRLGAGNNIGNWGAAAPGRRPRPAAPAAGAAAAPAAAPGGRLGAANNIGNWGAAAAARPAPPRVVPLPGARKGLTRRNENRRLLPGGLAPGATLGAANAIGNWNGRTRNAKKGFKFPSFGLPSLPWRGSAKVAPEAAAGNLAAAAAAAGNAARKAGEAGKGPAAKAAKKAGNAAERAAVAANNSRKPGALRRAWNATKKAAAAVGRLAKKDPNARPAAERAENAEKKARGFFNAVKGMFGKKEENTRRGLGGRAPRAPGAARPGSAAALGNLSGITGFGQNTPNNSWKNQGLASMTYRPNSRGIYNRVTRGAFPRPGKAVTSRTRNLTANERNRVRQFEAGKNAAKNAAAAAAVAQTRKLAAVTGINENGAGAGNNNNANNPFLRSLYATPAGQRQAASRGAAGSRLGGLFGNAAGNLPPPPPIPATGNLNPETLAAIAAGPPPMENAAGAAEAEGVAPRLPFSAPRLRRQASSLSNLSARKPARRRLGNFNRPAGLARPSNGF